jgi:hypothetical protein
MWRLYWMRRDLKWHGYEMMPSRGDLSALVQEIDEDPRASRPLLALAR